MKINKLDYRLALLLGFFEAFALLFLVIFEYGKNSLIERVLIGFFDGLLTGIIVLGLYNFLPFMKLKLPVLKISIANGFFLSFMFFIEYFTNIFRDNFLNILILGFFVALISGFVFIFVYNFMGKISYNTVILIGLFEMFILPIMLYLLSFEYFNKVIDYFFSGLISGIIGSLIAIVTYNFIISKKIIIEVKL